MALEGIVSKPGKNQTFEFPIFGSRHQLLMMAN